MVEGLQPGVKPAAIAAHLDPVVSGLQGINFTVATYGSKQVPAVLMGLTHEAATAFAARHPHGMVDPGSVRELKWRRMFLSDVR